MLRKGKDRHQIPRAKCINLLGGKCECCGEDTVTFLCIDHRNGGGNKHRKVIKGTKFIVWLLRRLESESLALVKKEFRILCHNCNAAFSILGYCPHRGQR
jgi:hypothetical protein